MVLVLVLIFDLGVTGQRFKAIIGEIDVGQRSNIHEGCKSRRLTVNVGSRGRFIVNIVAGQKCLRAAKVEDSPPTLVRLV